MQRCKTDSILKNNYKLIKDEALLLYKNKDKLLNMKDLSQMDFGYIDTEENSWKIHGKFMENSWKIHEKFMENSWKIHGKFMESLFIKMV